MTDRNTYQAGVDIGFAGFHVGGGYFYDDQGVRAVGGADASGVQNTFGLGATYSLGPLTVGGTWLHSRKNREPFDSEKLDRYLIGARYALGPGVDLRSSAQYYDYKGALGAGTGTSSGASNNNAWVFVFGTVLTF